MALSLSSNNYGLMQTARRRRNVYFILAVTGLAVSIMSFIAPEAVLSLVKLGGGVLLILYVFALLFSGLLTTLLMKKAANNLQ
jgi:hypothetical protein